MGHDGADANDHLDDVAASLCAMAVVTFNSAKSYYEEKHDKATFVKNIISDTTPASL